ncbi:uncharacterized protein [Typha angustifolia]|uniref:uncharacterized protein n=1 Tax=Typha angustifolia TaxID=59011 RepID=UPI003C2ABF35
MLCCFRCSSKTTSGKKGRNDVMKHDLEADEGWGHNEEILTDFSTFSLKEQQRKLKKARKEEAEASRAAEKVVNWVKQASARIDATVIDELLTDGGKRN